MSKEPDWKQLMLTLFGGFRQEASEEAIGAYVIACMDIPYQFVRQAVIDAIRRDKWMPHASELRERAVKRMPKKRDPYLQKLLEDGRQRKQRLIEHKPSVQTFTSYQPERTRISDTELEKRRQAFLDQLPTE